MKNRPHPTTSAARARALATACTAALGLPILAMPVGCKPAPPSAAPTFSPVPSPPTAVPGVDPKIVTKGIGARYSHAQTFTAKFKTNLIQWGRLTFLRPDRIRWQFDFPAGDVIVCDGHEVWLYDGKSKKLKSQPMAESPWFHSMLFLSSGDLFDSIYNAVACNDNFSLHDEKTFTYYELQRLEGTLRAFFPKQVVLLVRNGTFEVSQVQISPISSALSLYTNTR